MIALNSKSYPRLNSKIPSYSVNASNGDLAPVFEID